MHLEILSTEQKELLPFVQRLKSKFYLVGGTSIALQIGHRQSIDFDLFCQKPFSVSSIHKIIAEKYTDFKILHKSDDQIHYLLNGVKITFFYYPYNVPANTKFEDIINMPDLLTLTAMKAFALGRRSKWKDYVDLYFLLKHHVAFNDVGLQAKKLFGEAFSVKLFRQQLAYFEDIDYQEKVFYTPKFEVADEKIKAFLIEIATTKF